jgi:hypothetical protein
VFSANDGTSLCEIHSFGEPRVSVDHHRNLLIVTDFPNNFITFFELDDPSSSPPPPSSVPSSSPTPMNITDVKSTKTMKATTTVSWRTHRINIEMPLRAAFWSPSTSSKSYLFVTCYPGSLHMLSYPDGAVLAAFGRLDDDHNNDDGDDGGKKLRLRTFYEPEDIVVDPQSGFIYIADTGNHRVRVLQATQSIIIPAAPSLSTSHQESTEAKWHIDVIHDIGSSSGFKGRGFHEFTSPIGLTLLPSTSVSSSNNSSLNNNNGSAALTSSVTPLSLTLQHRLLVIDSNYLRIFKV